MFKRLVVVIGILLFAAVPCFGAMSVTLTTHRDCNRDSGCLDTYRWDFVTEGTTAVDATKTVDMYGKIVGVKFIETSIATATTVKLLDQAGRDVLQGLFTDTEASATATADNHYRVAVDNTSGGYIFVKGEVYIDISSAGDDETGAVEVYVIPYNSTLPPGK
jgi:hypothetical protein